MPAPLFFSARAGQTCDPPISYFMQQAVENPHLISLAAGLVDPVSLPAAEVQAAVNALFADRSTAQAALQYGTTQGYAPLREKILAHAQAMDGVQAGDGQLSVNDVVVTSGSQQLLYLLGEALFDPGDIVITEAPSYFVYHGALASLGVRTMAVPMDEEGMITDALEVLLNNLDRNGELDRVRLIYTIDYFQNPTGLTLSWPRRQKLLNLVQRYSRRRRILILEDAAYRELRYNGPDIPSIKSLDRENAHVILAMTFSKPLAPGFKTGYGLLPRDLVGPLLRFKGNHDFGSSNFNQHVLDRLLAGGVLDRHVEELRTVYRAKRDALLAILEDEFPAGTDPAMTWTNPSGGMYVWLRGPEGFAMGPDSRFMKAALAEGVLYVPGEFCYVHDDQGKLPSNEARLCFGVASLEQIQEAGRRLGRAARAAAIPKIRLPRFAGCNG